MFGPIGREIFATGSIIFAIAGAVRPTEDNSDSQLIYAIMIKGALILSS